MRQWLVAGKRLALICSGGFAVLIQTLPSRGCFASVRYVLAGLGILLAMPLYGQDWQTQPRGERLARSEGVREAPLQALGNSSPQGAARVRRGAGTLPNDQGQIWREYEISPYTSRRADVPEPEKAIVDWILRETGYEAWHGSTAALLSADSDVLRAYHTPEIQRIVAEVADRFVRRDAADETFSLRIVSLKRPDWRAAAQRLLRPVAVRTPGAQAWTLAKEDASLLLASLRRRTDYREHNSAQMVVANGEPIEVSTRSARNYVRNLALRANAWPSYEPEFGQIEEGFTVVFQPLLTLDGQFVDGIFKCEIDQVERFFTVGMPLPNTATARQQAELQVPQMAGCRFHERFRWPKEQVLLLSLGLVPQPTGAEPPPSVLGLSLPVGPSRAELLIFAESKGPRR